MDIGVIDHVQMQEYLNNGTVFNKSKQYVIVADRVESDISNPFKNENIEFTPEGIIIKKPATEEKAPESTVEDIVTDEIEDVLILEDEIETGVTQSDKTESFAQSPSVEGSKESAQPEPAPESSEVINIDEIADMPDTLKIDTQEIQPSTRDQSNGQADIIDALLEGDTFVIYFDCNQTTPIESQQKAIPSLIKRFKEKISNIDDYIFTITGYTDPVASNKYNEQLGLARATNISYFFTENQLKTEVISKGECCQQKTAELSRRVEIKVKKLSEGAE
jgi:outer membrane protein OmpA-like peptidoglycan-associated protein